MENYNGQEEIFVESPGTMAASGEITFLLKAWEAGDRMALDRLMPLVYAEMYEIARRHLKRERSGNSLQTTALINEAYLRLVNVNDVNWKDRSHFFAVSAKVMRHILLDAARTRSAAKRGGQAQRVAHSSSVNLDEIADTSSRRADELIAVDDALNTLAQLDARKAQVVELRFFGGLDVGETAEVLGVSQQTVMRDWRLARAWLMRELAK